MAEYNPESLAAAYDIQPTDAVASDFATNTTLSIVARQDAILDVEAMVYDDSPFEVIRTIPIMDTTMAAAELGRRGELDAGLQKLEEDLLTLTTEQEITLRLLPILKENGYIDVPLREDGTLDPAIEVPYKNVKAAALQFMTQEQYEDFFNQSREAYREGFEADGGIIKGYSNTGFRSIDYVESLTDRLASAKVNMELLSNPTKFDPEVIAELQAAIDKAAPCIYDSRNESLDNLDCAELGDEVGRILTTAQVAMNDNEESLVPASGMNVLGLPKIEGVNR